MRPALVLPESLTADRLLVKLKEERRTMAILADEYGGTAGLITMEDVVETLLGAEILDETDAVQDLRKHARERWKRRAAQQGLRAEPEDSDTATPAQEPQGSMVH